MTGYNWKMVPHDIKDFYWQEFQVRIGSKIYFILFLYILINNKCCFTLVLLFFFLMFFYNVDKVELECE